MKTLLNGWNLMRVFRLVLGIGILIHGIVQKDTVSIILGVALGAMALANVGSCGVNGCDINKPPVNELKRVNYEELDIKK